MALKALPHTAIIVYIALCSLVLLGAYGSAHNAPVSQHRPDYQRKQLETSTPGPFVASQLQQRTLSTPRNHARTIKQVIPKGSLPIGTISITSPPANTSTAPIRSPSPSPAPVSPTPASPSPSAPPLSSPSPAVTQQSPSPAPVAPSSPAASSGGSTDTGSSSGAPNDVSAPSTTQPPGPSSSINAASSPGTITGTVASSPAAGSSSSSSRTGSVTSDAAAVSQQATAAGTAATINSSSNLASMGSTSVDGANAVAATGTKSEKEGNDTYKLVLSIVIPVLTGLAAIATIAYTGWKWWHKRKATLASRRAAGSAYNLHPRALSSNTSLKPLTAVDV